MAKQETRQEAVRNAKKRLVETLAAKHRLEMRLTDLRQDAVKWHEREALAAKAGDAALMAAAVARTASIDSAVESTKSDLDSLDVDIVRLRSEVNSAGSPSNIPASLLDAVEIPLPIEEPRAPGSSSKPTWESLLSTSADQEIAEMRQRRTSPRTETNPGVSKER